MNKFLKNWKRNALTICITTICILIFGTGNRGYVEVINDVEHTPSEGALQNVGFNGAATHAIPIAVPPGRSGIAPNLTLQYNSNQKNGWLGVGWSLDMGSIQRSTKYGLDYTNNTDDTPFFLSLGGSTSELVPRTDWGSGYYGARIEGSFDKIKLTNPNTPDSSGFEYHSKEGLTYKFGTTAESRQTSGIGTFKWCLDTVYDMAGNYMTVIYRKDDRRPALSQKHRVYREWGSN